MSYTLVLNFSNVIGTNNNTYQYNFIKGSFTIQEGAEIMVSSIQVPYSWFYIAATYNNNSFKIFFPTTRTFGHVLDMMAAAQH